MKAGLVKTLLLPAVAIAMLFFATTWLDGRVERVAPKLDASYEDTDPTFNASRMRGFSLGLEGLIADWYWLRSLQYLGGKIARNGGITNIDDLRPLNPRLLYPYLDSATDLDPQFIAAYSYGAIVLPAIDPEKAIAIANKGIANNPANWELYQHLGYIYWKLGRYDEASDAYRQGSEIPGSGQFLGLMAAAMKTQGGSRETARAIYNHVLETSSDNGTRYPAQVHLQQIDALDDVDAISAALAEFREKSGRCAGNLNEIHTLLLKVKLPAARDFALNDANQIVDPTGVPYLLDREACVAKIDFQRSKLPPL